ncbi:MAG: molybdenum cofactor biosynthesis protein MoaE [Pseudomonas sp.]
MSHLTHEPIDIQALLALDRYADCGGLALFVGTVRNHHQGRSVASLSYTAYVPLASKRIAEIEADACRRFGLSYCRVVHRLGQLRVGEAAIACVARAGHRVEAFDACRHVVDEVKHQAPIWKEEHYTDGSSAYVEGCCIRPDAHRDTCNGDHP